MNGDDEKRKHAAEAFRSYCPSLVKEHKEVVFQDNAGRQYVGTLSDGSDTVRNLQALQSEGDSPKLDSVLDVNLVGAAADEEFACPMNVKVVRSVFAMETSITGIAAFASIVASSGMSRLAPMAGDGGAYVSTTVAAVFVALAVCSVIAYTGLQFADIGHAFGESHTRRCFNGRIRVIFWVSFVLCAISFLVLMSLIMDKRGFMVTEFFIESWASSISVLVVYTTSYSRGEGGKNTLKLWLAMIGSMLMVWVIFLIDVSSKKDFHASLITVGCVFFVNICRFAWIVFHAGANRYMLSESTHALIDMYTLAVVKTSRFCTKSKPSPPPPLSYSTEVESEEIPLT
jgi:hypothetical protein